MAAKVGIGLGVLTQIKGDGGCAVHSLWRAICQVQLCDVRDGMHLMPTCTIHSQKEKSGGSTRAVHTESMDLKRQVYGTTSSLAVYTVAGRYTLAMAVWTYCRYRVGQTGAETSQSTKGPSQPTQLDLSNLRAKLGKVYEDVKEDPVDVTTMSSFYYQFLEKVSLRRSSRKVSTQHRRHVGSVDYAPTPSMECYSDLSVREPVGPVRTKGHPKIATRIRSGIETCSKNRWKRCVVTVGNKDIYPRGVQNISLVRNYYKTSRTDYNCN